MFTYFPLLVGASAVFEGARRIILSRFSNQLGQYSAPNAQVGLEILLTHLAHASTLTTKAQFCTGFVTFVSATYKGEAAAVLIGLINELRNMKDPSDVDVQAGDAERDIEAECLELLREFPNGALKLPMGADMHVQASWDDVRLGFGSGVDCFKAVRYAPFYKHARKILAACLAGSLLSDSLASNHKWFHTRLFEGVDHKSGPDPVDLFDEVLDLTRVVFDAATMCIQTNSFRPLLGRGQEAYLLDTEYAFLASHQEYFMIGSLERVTESSGAKVTYEEYIGRLERYQAQLTRYHKGSRDAERLILTRRLIDVAKWDAEIKEKLGRASMRPEPYAMLLLGPTAQGKTATGMSIMRHTLEMNKFPHRQENVAQVDSASKYMDTVQNSTMGVFMDDVANTKPQYQTVDALAQFIQLKNTSVVPVSKAGVDDKGKVFHNSKVVIVSTNKADLNATETSNEPSAVMRRFTVTVRVSVTEEYSCQMDSSTLEGLGGRRTLNMIDPSKLTNGIYSDHQRFDVLKWAPFERTQAMSLDKGDHFIVVHQGRPLKGLRYYELMEYIKIDSAAHFANQARMLMAFQRDEELPLCKHGAVTEPFCGRCAAERLEVQAGNPIVDFFLPRAGDADSPLVSDDSADDARSERSDASVRSVSTAASESPPQVVLPWGVRARARAHHVYHSARCLWDRATVGEPVPEPPAFVGYMRAWSHGRFDIERLAFTHFDAVMLGLLAVAPGVAFFSAGFMSLLGGGLFMETLTWCATFAYTGISISRNARGWVQARVAGATLQELKTRTYEMAKASLGVLGAILAVLTLVQGLRKLCAPAPAKRDAASVPTGTCRNPFDDFEYQGGVSSNILRTPPDGAVPDPVPKVNTWERRDVAVWYDVGGHVRNMTAEQIFLKAAKQVYVMTIHYASGNVVTSNCLMVATNYMMAPAHNFLTPTGGWSDIGRITIQSTTELRGPVFSIKVSPRQMLRLPGDAMLVQVNAGGTMPDITELFVEKSSTVAFPVVELYRLPETCAISQTRYLATPENIVCASHNMRYTGYSYIRPQDTFKGLCGALHMVDARFPQIVGFHTMGRAARGVGCALTRETVLAGIAELRSTALLACPVVVQESTNPFTPAGMEAAGMIGPLCERSVLRETIPGTEFKPLGTFTNYRQVRPSTRLEVSPLSDIIREECDEERKHEPPQTIGKATVEVLKLKEMYGRTMLNPDDMALAMEDQYDELCAAVESLDFAKHFKVLTLDEATSGVAGCHSVRAINRGTAAGWPFVGNKHPFVTDNPRPGLPDAFSLTPDVVADVERAMETMGRLERCNFVFKGSHKDEPVKIGKMKTRVFEGSPLVLTVITRMLFMPMIRLYLLARCLTGSAVGIDATSAEWDDLYNFMTQYNGEVAVVGDWVHFDTSQVYQEMMAVFCIWIAVYEKYGSFSAEEINAMWVVAEETSRHFALLRGDVGITEGTNPSGGVVTVYLNNPVGELRFKSAFYGMAREQGLVAEVPLWDHMEEPFSTGGLRIGRNGRAGFKPLLPNLRGRFGDYVRASYYGDDFIQAARDEVLGWYNQQTLFSYFQKEGLQLTDANKQPFETPTTPWHEVTFLKRHFRPDADTNCVMGPLAMDSIYKSLHVWPKTTQWGPQVHAAQIFAGSLRELFQHGKVEYERRAPALLRAAERFGSGDYLAKEALTYEAMYEQWYKKEVSTVATFEAAVNPPSE